MKSKRVFFVAQVTNGSMMTRVVGPQPDDGGKYWIIDGRDEEVPAGTAPRQFFRWAVDRASDRIGVNRGKWTTKPHVYGD